jgi:hypothetical protein
VSVEEERPECSARRHGDAAAYCRYRCRCADAREDYRLYRKRARQGRPVPRWVDSTGSARRLQALAALGYGLLDLAEHLEWGKSRVRDVQSMRAPLVRVATAERVARVYDELAMTPGPSTRARDLARRRGWVPPLAWDDDEIDDPQARPARGLRRWATPPNPERIAAALAGDLEARRALTGPDRQQLVRQLHAEGLLDPEIVARTGMSIRNVLHLRSQMCLPNNMPHSGARAG